MEASQAKGRLQQEVSDKERALHEDRLRGFQENESMKRNHEFYVDEFSRTKSQQNQNTINNLMDRVRELQCEINYMHDSKDFKDAESVHSGQLSHVPSESTLLPPQDERRDLLGRAKIMPPNIWNALFTLGNVITSPPAHGNQFFEVFLGRKQGRKEGRQAGRKEGRKEGRKQRRKAEQKKKHEQKKHMNKKKKSHEQKKTRTKKKHSKKNKTHEQKTHEKKKTKNTNKKKTHEPKKHTWATQKKHT